MRNLNICLVQLISPCDAQKRKRDSGGRSWVEKLSDAPFLFPYNEPSIENGKLSRVFSDDNKFHGLNRLTEGFIRDSSEIYTKQLERIVKHAVDCGAELLVFPEYSIPLKHIETIGKLSKEYGITIVAGTHSLQRGEWEKYPYKDLVEKNCGLDWDILAICPIFTPDCNGKPHLVFKQIASRYEKGLTQGAFGEERGVITVPYRKSAKKESKEQQTYTICINICAEYVVQPNIDPELNTTIQDQVMQSLEDVDITIVVGWSPKSEPFLNRALTFLESRKHGGRNTIAFCNTALYGGSFITTYGDSKDSVKEGNQIKKDAEALLIRSVQTGTGAGKAHQAPSQEATQIQLVYRGELQSLLWEQARKINAKEYDSLSNLSIIQIPNSLYSLYESINKTISESDKIKESLSIDLKSFLLFPETESFSHLLHHYLIKSIEYLSQVHIDFIPQVDVGAEISTLTRKAQLLQKINVEPLQPSAGYNSENSNILSKKANKIANSLSSVDLESEYDFCFRVSSIPSEDFGVAYQTRLTSQIIDFLSEESHIDTIELRFVSNELKIHEKKVNIFFLFKFSNILTTEAKKELAADIFLICDNRLLTYTLEPTDLQSEYFRDFGEIQNNTNNQTCFLDRHDDKKTGLQNAFLGRSETASIVKILAHLVNPARVSLKFHKKDDSTEKSSLLFWVEDYTPNENIGSISSMVTTTVGDLQDLQEAHHSFEFQQAMFSPNSNNGQIPNICSEISMSFNKDEIQTISSAIAFELAGGERYKLSSKKVNIMLAEREMYHLFKLPFGHNLPGFRKNNDPFLLSLSNLPDTSDGICIGEVDVNYEGRKDFYWKESNRSKHMYIIGQTGTGKSYFMSSLISNDISKGKGLMLLDPHGDLVETIIDRIPKKRLNDVILFDPDDKSTPPALNLLEADLSDQFDRSRVLDEAISIFIALYGPEIFGPRLQRYFSGAVMSLMDYHHKLSVGSQATLAEVGRIFIDEEFRRTVKQSALDPLSRLFWKEYDESDYREKKEIIPYFLAKFSPFFSNAQLKAISDKPHSTLNLRQAIDNESIVLVNLSKGKLGDLASRLIGMILVSKLNWAMQSRVDTSKENRHNFGLYVDEFQNFVSPTFATMLSEARKYGLSLVLANQYLSQLRVIGDYTRTNEAILRDAVFGNAGTIIAFRSSMDDSLILAKAIVADSKVTIDKTASTIKSSPNYQAIMSTIDGDTKIGPIRLHSKVFRESDVSSKKVIVENSRIKNKKSNTIQLMKTIREKEKKYMNNDYKINYNDVCKNINIIPQISWSVGLLDNGLINAVDAYNLDDAIINISEDEIENLVQGLSLSKSLSIQEKNNVLNSLNELSEFQVKKLIKVFSDEIQKFNDMFDKDYEKTDAVKIFFKSFIEWPIVNLDFIDFDIQSAVEMRIEKLAIELDSMDRLTVAKLSYDQLQNNLDIPSEFIGTLREIIASLQNEDS